MKDQDRIQGREEAIARVVAEYERSGLTRRSFSEETGIAVSTLDYWRRQIREQGRTRIVPVKIEPERQDQDARVRTGGVGFRVSLPNGVRIESNWEFPEQGLTRLLRVAAER